MRFCWIFCLLLLSSCGCNDDDCNNEFEVTDYNFIIPTEVIPQELFYNVGDTLIVKYDFSDMVEELNDGLLYHLVNYKFNVVFRMSNLEKTNPEIHFTDYFDIHELLTSDDLIVDHSSSGGQSLLHEFIYADERYSSLITMVARVPGHFYIRIFLKTIALPHIKILKENAMVVFLTQYLFYRNQEFMSH